jgi:DNA processing protein
MSTTTSGQDADLLRAAAYLSRVAEPASVPVWMLSEELGYLEAAAAIRDGAVDDDVAAATAARRLSVDAEADLDAAARHGIRLLTPVSEEWPHFAFAALYASARTRAAQWRLGDKRRAPRGELIPPLALWVRGSGELAGAGVRSVAVVGSRASTSYGESVCTDWSYRLAMQEVTVVSGGAYGIDAAAHRGALAAGGVSILVSAGGLDRPYPAGNAALYDRLAERGLLISERPPGSAPHRQRFLSRNRLIAALGSVTLVVEAAYRSGALNSAGYARDLGRPVLAVPGPITSAMSQGCHQLLRRPENPAVLAGRIEDVLEYCSGLSEIGAPATSSLAAGAGGPAGAGPSAAGAGVPAGAATMGGASQGQLFAVIDSLSHSEQSVLDGVPSRGWVTESQLSTLCAKPIQVVIAALPVLVERGLLLSGRQGYRLLRAGAAS